jgi:N,N'-diacetyllegionaminate synthase
MDLIWMTKLIAETAWHHEGDFVFMKNLVTRICEESKVDIVKFHISLDIDEYMSEDHNSYETLKSWMFSSSQWEDLIDIVRKNGKEIMLLLNDTEAIKFAKKFKPELIELHSVCLNVPRLQEAVIENIDVEAKVVIGIGGCSLDEVKKAVQFFNEREIVLMFGFQNYPTKYEDVNLGKIRKIQSLYTRHNFGYADHTSWDEENNELISLLVCANGMDYIEKHVTTDYGIKRCDYSAAISIEQVNMLYKKIKLLESLYGSSSMLLNKAEEEYSKYGPMKMAAIAKRHLIKGSELTTNDFHFCRTSQATEVSQIDLLESLGKNLVKDVKINEVINWNHIREK